ncbi:MAG: family transcriptional regulator, cyclic receptor protein [Pseudonocardiales bacterium]|jgi:CRP-like cAMP-binding protein|nr:family transcriptional regulator, cyclic receptor protein [Pseudonocardiales bacterium]
MFATRTHRVSRTRQAALRRIPMFAELSPAELARIASQMAEIEVPAGSTLMTEREHGREALIIADGLAEISIDGRPVSSVSAGDLVGEVALLDSGPRTATVTALTNLRVYVLDPRQFSILFESPQSARWIATELARRLRELAEHSRTASGVLVS